MITVDEALANVLAHATCRSPVQVATSDALGLMLAEQIVSDIDSPPYDKALMDGYAVVASAATDGAELVVVEEVPAGAVPSKKLGPESATRIMTGAPIPDGADTVIMVERTELLVGDGQAPDRVRILQAAPPASNIMPRGTSLRRDQVVLAPGTKIRPIEIGLLAEVGCTQLRIWPAPQVAVLATGDELVPPEQFPGEGQIRNSNGPMLRALIENRGACPIMLGIGRDDRQTLRTLVQRGLQYDVLLLSGGVSAGKFDLVPSVLAELGVRQVFHKVRLKPGKPIWFGVAAQRDPGTLVFGLPGNPVSTLVCFELFVRPVLGKLAGSEKCSWVTRTACLREPFRHRGDRPTYFPSTWDDAENQIRLLDWQGSADLRTLADAQCLTVFPAGERDYQAGDRVEVFDL